MIYGKLTDGKIEMAPNPLVIDEKHVFTNDPEIFMQQGYKPIEYEPAPECPEGYSLSCSWAEEEGRIARVWELTPAPDEEGTEEVVQE